ncbi:MAG: hypothetical protein IKN27_11545 [Selenomonadaceae bacterium]|nr:hypothetical protein [Selenomonadaceae bacterium]
MIMEEIKIVAFEARALYKIGAITRSEARKKIDPYIEIFNSKAVEIARKYNMKPKKISFAGFLR